MNGSKNRKELEMKRTCAFAAMAAAVVCACEVQATPIDWNAVSSKTYTVPADTTNEVTTAEEFAKVTNLLTKVIFANANSTLRFTVSTFPDSVTFQGPGTVLMDETVVLDKQYTYLRRSLGEGDETNFVKFVFANGIDVATEDMAYFLRGNEFPFENASIYIDGTMATNIQVYSASSFKGRYDLGKNFKFEHPVELNAKFGYNIGVLRQRGGDIVQPNVTGDGMTFGRGVGSHVAWLFEGGSYTVENAGKYLCFYGNYTYFRQTGGLFAPGRFAINNNASGDIRPDFVFGGDGVVDIRGRTCPFRNALYAFADSTKFMHTADTSGRFYNLSRNGNTIWAHNGGVANYAFHPTWSTNTGNESSGPTNNFFAFNGGLRGFSSEYTNANVAVKSLFGHSPAVRIYENGGGLLLETNKCWNLTDFEIREPEGNVVKSIPLSDEVRNMVWQYPPSVEIYDEGGDGTNAAAVVDYDFDTGRITNISIMCKGENYSANTIANLRYKAGRENWLLMTPLCVEVGPEQGGDFIFASTNLGAEVVLNHATNFTHGALVVDMDRLGLADYGAYTAATWGNTLRLHYINNSNAARAAESIKNSHFPNVTNIVLKSGCIDSYNNEGGWGYNHTYNPCGILPNCWRLELYGGHLTGGSARFEDVVIGGEIWLINHGLHTSAALHSGLIGGICVCRTSPTNDNVEDYPGLLTVDVACLTNGVTPKIKYGKVHFVRGQVNPNTTIPLLSGRTNSVVTVKNWECIPKSRTWTTILDLSDNVAVNEASGSRTFCVPDIVYPEGSEGELVLQWEMNPEDETKPYKLLARRIVNDPIFTIEDGVLVGVDLNGATEVMIPDSVTNIGDWAFSECADLRNVTIPDSVACIGPYAFSGCANLVDVMIPNNVTNIGYWAFGYCESLTDVTIPDSVEDMGDHGFYGCDSLTNVTILGNVTYIDVSTFEGCTNLTSVAMPDSVTYIEPNAFVGCSSLTSITIPSNVAGIMNGAFGGCSNLMNVTFLGNAPGFGWEWYNDSDSDGLPDWWEVVADENYRRTDMDPTEEIGWNTVIDYHGQLITAGEAYMNEVGVFEGVSDDCTIYVSRDSTGWGVDIPGTWGGMRIEYLEGEFDFDGDAEWTLEADGSWRSGTITHNQESSIIKTMLGVGTVSFDWKVSSESDYDWLTFSGVYPFFECGNASHPHG